MRKRNTGILRTLLITIAAVAALLAVIIIAIKVFDIVRTDEDRKTASRFGLYVPADVGGHSLNVVSYGNDTGHTLVFLAGLGIEDMSITYRDMTDVLAKDNKIVFIDRAGYGLSDDTATPMDVENIVEDYRKALGSCGIEGPYVLVAHSLGGVYATFWESTHPEQIEGVVFLDSTQLREDTFPEGKLTNTHERSEILMNKLGLFRFSVPGAEDIPEGEDLKGASSRLSYLICNSSLWNEAMDSEYDLISSNCNKTWKKIASNDIPKVYICATWGSDTDQKYIDARENILKPYLAKMGNCDLVLLPGIHLIYEQRPVECAKIIEDLLKRI